MVGIHLHRREARGPVRRQILRGVLIYIQRHEVHRGMMIFSVPSVAFQKPIDDVLPVRILPVHGDDAGEFRPLRCGFESGRKQGSALDEVSTASDMRLRIL